MLIELISLKCFVITLSNAILLLKIYNWYKSVILILYLTSIIKMTEIAMFLFILLLQLITIYIM